MEQQLAGIFGAVPQYRGWNVVVQFPGMRTVPEIAVTEALLLALAIGFDQARFWCELVQRVLQCRSDGLILGKIQHYKRD